MLPYNDVLVKGHRKEYLELLTSIEDRRKLLDFVYNLDYNEAEKNRKKLEAISDAYEQLMHRLQELALEFGSIGSEDEELWGEVTSGEKLESLDVPATGKQRVKTKLAASEKGPKRGRRTR